MKKLSKLFTDSLSMALVLGSLSAQAQQTSATPETQEEKAAEVGFTTIFNGKNYDGWYIKLKDGDEALGKKVFAIHDGMIHVFDDSWPDEIDLNKGTDGTIGMMYTKKSYSRYHLKFDYKWGHKKANYFKKWPYDAGVYYHISDDKVFPTGVEYQIQYLPKGDRNRTGDLIKVPGQAYDWYFNLENSQYQHPDDGGVLFTKQKSYVGRSWLYNAKITRNFNGLNDEWNSCEIIVMGGEYAIHKLNGEVVNMAFNLKPSEGIIGFQSETAEIFYRDIRIKEFDESVPAETFLISEALK
jgi:hypothetical protein